MYACICHAVTSDELDAVIAAGATDVRTVGEACGAGTGCGSCLDRLADRCAEARRRDLTVLLGGAAPDHAHDHTHGTLAGRGVDTVAGASTSLLGGVAAVH